MDTTIVLVLVAVAAFSVVGVVLFLRRRPRQDDSTYHFRCPKCKRRIRYLSKQVGHKGKCSNCAGDVIFPPITQSID